MRKFDQVQENKEKKTLSIYKRATAFQLIFSQMSTASSMIFFSLAGLMSYLANEGYGITMSVTGVILTVTRVFDGLIDPFLAITIDRINTKFGKIRLLLIIGWVIRSFSIFLLFIWGSHLGYGMIYFISIYLLYIVGSSISDISGNMIAPVITNDPSQRPFVQVWGTLYSYLVPILFTLITTLIILPKYGNYYSLEMLKETAVLFIPVSFIATLFCIFSISKIDKPENFMGVSLAEKNGAVNISDMIRLFRRNRPFQMYLVSSVVTKLAQHISSQAIITTLFFGILVGDLQEGTILNVNGHEKMLVFGH